MERDYGAEKTLRYRPHYFKYKDLYYKPQNHSTVTT